MEDDITREMLDAGSAASFKIAWRDMDDDELRAIYAAMREQQRKDMSKSGLELNTSEQPVVATYTRVPTGHFFSATAAGLALPPGKYRLCVARGDQ